MHDHSHEEHAGHSHDHGSHGGHDHSDHAAQFRSKFWLTLILSLPVVFFSPGFADMLGYTTPDFPLSLWIAPILGTVIYFYGGMPFLTGGWEEAKAKQPGMMLLIAMAITVAFVASWATTLNIGGLDLDFWWELALLVVIMLLGHWMEMRALGQASGALDAIAELLPDDAERIVDGTGDNTETVSLDDLQAGDIVLVRSGGRVPADGVVQQGSAEFDESMITGESKPVNRAEGDQVVAGTIATNNTVRIAVEKTGDDTALAGIRTMVEDAQNSGSRAQALADRAAAWLFWFALGAGILTAIIWSIVGTADDAIVRTVTVLVIACPHALGLAIPLVIAISTERAAKHGILIKDRLALENTRTIDAVLFDKTGTLTKGEHRVTDTIGAHGDAGRYLALAAAAEADSEHPVAKAIIDAAKQSEEAEQFAADHKIETSDFEAASGRGVTATVEVDGTTVEVTVGGPNMMRQRNIDEQSIANTIRSQVDEWKHRGASVLYVLEDGEVTGAIALEDTVRPESKEAVRQLQDRGIHVAMITGDAQQVADAVAQELDIDEVFAEVLPKDKDSKVTELQQRGQKVAMVGDGVNDAPALARAEVGVAIGAGTDVAMESAGVILASDDPRGLVAMTRLSEATYKKMWQNLVWASGYNVLAVPLAAGVLAPIGFVLSPAVGAVLMSLSTIVVAFNAQLLRRVELS